MNVAGPGANELELPEVLKHDRMGHQMRGVAAVYSHVTPAMRHQVRTRLQDHWEAHAGFSSVQAA
ncbi:hypothetical protein Pen01_48000 [Phytomonospora endophytica]|nr:hypothetical protein Pen01_48000 [Phytomonospora endophytica]